MSALNVTVYCKGRERYVWIYTDSRRSDALRSVGKFAAHPDLSFTWWDAARVSKSIRTTLQDTSEETAKRRRNGHGRRWNRHF